MRTLRRLGGLFTACTLLSALVLWGAGCGGTGPGYQYDPYGTAQPPVFYDALSPYGRWVMLNPYGWVWSPYDTWSDWRPYTLGTWAYSDWGWMWLSDEPWGWAPYHYGRWGYDSSYGWVWVPGDVWAPAWVAWRYGDGYVGWAPLSPDIQWNNQSGLRTTGSDFTRTIDTRAWSFVQGQDLIRTDLKTRILPTVRNASLVHMTRNTTRLKPIEGRAAERGLSRDLVERRVGSAVPTYAVRERVTSGPGRPVTVQGRTIDVVRPQTSLLTPPEGASLTKRSRPLGDQQRAAVERQEREQRQLQQQQEREQRELQKQQQRERDQVDRERERQERERERMEQEQGQGQSEGGGR